MSKKSRSTTVTKPNKFLAIAFDAISIATNHFISLISKRYITILVIISFLLFLAIFIPVIPNLFRIVIAVLASLFLIAAILSKYSNIKAYLYIYISIIILALFGGIFIYVVIEFLLDILKTGLPKELLAVLITALATVGGIIAGNIYKSNLDLKQQRINDKIIPIYEKLIELLVKVKNQTLTAKERVKLINELDEGIWKWGAYKARDYWHKVKPSLLSQELFDSKTQTELTQLVLILRKQVELPDESDTQIRKLIGLEQALPPKTTLPQDKRREEVLKILDDIRRRRESLPTDVEWLDSTQLIREDRDR